MNLIPSLIYTAIPNPSPERTQQWSITYKVTRTVEMKWAYWWVDETELR